MSSVQVFHGDDGLAMQRAVQALYAGMGDPAIADLNTARLDGRTASEEDLRTAVMSIPFLAPRRLVILTYPLGRISGGEQARQRFTALLDVVPESTQLVLLIDDERKGSDWKVMKETPWLSKWIQKAGGRVAVQTFALPSQKEMPGWIAAKVREMKGSFHPAAARVLADHVGTDTRQAALEIEKLLTYVNFSRPVEAEDVDLLCASTAPLSVFDLVDAIALGESRKAMSLLHGLMDQDEPLGLFAMIVRQFRLLIQAREIIDEGGGEPEILGGIKKVHPYVAKKLNTQARRFSQERLLQIYRRLLETDVSIKTGQSAPDLALDTLVAELTR